MENTAPDTCSLLLIDDCSDTVTHRFLENLQKQHPRITVYRNSQNLGFVKSCNTGLKQGTAPFAMIVNSDVVVTEGWLERLIACARQDPSIGLVNPLTNYASQIAIPLPAGLSFIDVNRFLRKHFEGQMADIVTGVGFCMLLRRQALAAVGLFDEIYGHGYCEESDLCMRLTTNGWRTVAAKDVYVYHKGKATYTDRDERYLKNRKLFDTRWAPEYHRQFKQFQQANPLQDVRKALSPFPLRLDIKPALIQTARNMLQGARERNIRKTLGAAVNGLLSLPNARHKLVTPDALKPFKQNTLSITYIMRNLIVAGGVLSVIQLVNELILLGVDARIAALHKDPLLDDWTKLYTQPMIYKTPDELIKNLPETDIVVSTLWITAEWAGEIIRKGRAKTGAYFLQDYEPWFFPEDDPGSRKRVEETYSFFSHHIAKSDWLCNQVSSHGITPHKIHLGMDLGIFYPREVQKSHPVVIAMARPRTPRRGFSHIIKALEQVKREKPETEIILFGDRFLSSYAIPFDFSDAGIIFNQSRLAQLYSKADVFLDGSDFQGFGRCALEAMACGAACVLTEVGGVGEYAQHGQNCLLIPPADPEAMSRSVIRLLKDDPLRQKLIQKGKETADRFCHKQEARKTLAYFQAIAAGEKADC